MDLAKRVSIVLALVVLLSLAVAGFFYRELQNSKSEAKRMLSDPETLRKATQEDIKRLIAEVGRLIELPTGEDPVVATVTDPERIKNQAFFAKAKRGDKVLIYTQARKAILYDPSAKKVIDVAPVNIGTASGSIAGLATPSGTVQQVRVVLRNGTETSGLTAKIEPKVKQSLGSANIIKKEDAAKNDYEKSTVVALFASFQSEAEKLAKDLGLATGNLPEGETKPDNADIVVILGKDSL